MSFSLSSSPEAEPLAVTHILGVGVAINLEPNVPGRGLAGPVLLQE